jgi:hypothetical protein
LRVNVTDEVDGRQEYTTINDVVADIARRAGGNDAESRL